MYEQRRPDVAVFIDFENVYVSVRDKLNANPNFEAIMDRCSDLGRVVISRAYADWYRYPRVTSALYANAIEPIYVATYYYDKDMGRTGRAIKNSVDMNLCIDAMKTLFVNTNISKFVLVTGDRDFIPLVNSIRQQGKEVYIIGIGGAASTHLAQSADEFVFYEQLVGRQTGGSVMATAIANRATEINRGLDAATFEPAPRERSREPVVPEPVAVATPVPPSPVPVVAEVDIYAVLVEAIHLVRKRGYVSTLGSIKLVMKELMGGDFKESRYRDLNNRPFAKFKDFVVDAEKRGKVQIFTSGTVNEVFLPGEDPYKLSQFAAALTDELPLEPVIDPSVSLNGRSEPLLIEPPAPEPPASSSRRRRRRSRRPQNAAHPSTEGVNPLLAAESALNFDDPDDATSVGDDELLALDHLEESAEVVAFFEEHAPDELMAADLRELHSAEPLLAAESPDLLALDSDGSDDAAWEAAASALAAQLLAPAEVDWEAMASEPEVPHEEAWEAVAHAVAAEDQARQSTDLEEVHPSEAAPVSELTEGHAEDAHDAEAVAETHPEAVAETHPEAVAETHPEAVAETHAEAAPEGGEPASTEVVQTVDETEEAPAGEQEVVEPILFTDEEWDVFRHMMASFAKPTSFQQIFDTLRGWRKEHNLARTNEQLRTMVKQAINNGILERSGRGKRIYYVLKEETPLDAE
ncbi:NYN domain-containing protein [Candidatus Chloroploca sp. M-50]|uniref:NYN domain-containing protein n=1 Tax=Candidatus Chloroploca mongolica TaxID=2528176 RepID=A0ABS4DB46_9CHLR|nr:NYN domain-containing protein [Candidatus Chloroploca mongolica]MBP1466665.1 NYN domain-containing protein [Candidatus Chloroploca mongolica]